MLALGDWESTALESKWLELMLVGRFALQNLRGGTAAIRRARVAQCCTNCGCVMIKHQAATAQ